MEKIDFTSKSGKYSQKSVFRHVQFSAQLLSTSPGRADTIPSLEE